MDHNSRVDKAALSDEMRMNVADLLGEMPGGFFMYRADEEERLVYANDACLRIFGCETLEQFEELTGFTFPGMVHPDDIQTIEASIKRQIANDVHKMDYVEYRIIARDGTIKWIEDYGHYVTTASGNYFYVFIDDATERLHERMSQLERMNEELNEAYNREHEHKCMLRRALQQANAANIAKTTFLNNMSHDIRTLLNAITGYAHLISAHAMDAERTTEYADRITEASAQLLDVVAETLEVSRFESGKTQLVEEQCLLSEIVASVEGRFAHKAAQAGVELMLEMRSIAHDSIFGDAQRITQVLSQLLDNSIKYTPAGGSVKLLIDELYDVAAGHAKFKITLSDTGVGMSEDFVDRVFEPFERERNTTDVGIPGTGLGLTIVRHIINLLSGSIAVTSVEGEGTTIEATFTTRLSARSEELQHAEREDAMVQSVLVVEDNTLNREIITCLLEDAGYDVRCVTNGQEAVETVAASAPGEFDLVLMDIQMPIMNGYEATRLIRELEDAELASIPIIAVTSDAFPEDRKRSLSAGMNAHVSKPVDIEELNEAIVSVV